MEVHNFIINDLAKSKNAGLLRGLLGIMLTFIAVGLGLGLRPDALGLSDPLYWICAAPLILILCFLPRLIAFDRAGAKIRWWIFWILVVCSFILSARPGAFSFEYVYGSDEEFWRETYNCFFNGAISSVAATIVIWFFQKFLPAPNERWLRALSMLPGIVGVTMLNVHCPADDVYHIALSHWLPGAILSLFTYFLTRKLLLRQLNSVLHKNPLTKKQVIEIIKFRIDS